MPGEAKEITGDRPTLYAHFRRMLFELPGFGIPGMIAFLDG